MRTLKEIYLYLESIGYGNKRNYKKIDVFCDGKYQGSTTWAKNLKVAKVATRLQVGFADKCKITAYYEESYLWKK